jgi:hypothetical protein
MSMKMEGLQSSPAGGSAAVNTFQSQMISLTMQNAPTLTSTDTTAGTPTALLVDNTTASSQATTGIGIGVFETASSGNYEARPRTVAGDTSTLLMALSAAPGVGDDILGAANIQFTYRPSATRSASIRFVGNDALQNRYVQGIVANMTIPEFGPADVPMLDWTLKGAAVQQNQSDTRGSATTPRGKVFAGGEVLIGAYGNTDALSICGSRIAVNAASGVAGFYRGAGSVRVEVSFPHDVIPSSITGNSSASWYEAWVTGGAESKFHLMFTCGQNVAAYSQTWYFPHLRIVEVQETTVNEMDARKVIFDCGTPLTSTEYEMDARKVIFDCGTPLTSTEYQAVCALW